MKPLQISPPELDCQPGAISSRRYGDIYFDREDGLAESRQVFVEGVNLEALCLELDQPVLIETGFGTGLNFLATLSAWRAIRKPGQYLHYLGVEAHPLTPLQLREALAGFAELRTDVIALCRRLPPWRAGFHRIFFEQAGVFLSLLYGEASDALGRLECHANAWYLDGFAPARNPSMWSPSLFDQIARLSSGGSRLASFSVAGEVRRELGARGFVCRKEPGIAKREVLRARLDGEPSTFARPAAMEIRGRGIAAAGVASALARRGISALGVGVNARRGPPATLVMPRIEAAANPLSRLFLAASDFALRLYGEMGRLHSEVLWVLEDQRRVEKLCRLWPDELRLLDSEEARARTGIVIEHSAMQVRSAAAFDGQALLTELDRMVPAAETPGAVVLTPGAEAVADPLLQDLPWQLFAGQQSAFAASGVQVPLAGRLSVLPGADRIWVGATFDRVSSAVAIPPREEASDRLRVLAATHLPALATRLDKAKVMGSWTGVRLTTPDRLPVVGCVDGETALVAGLGSRGFSLAPLLGELVVCQLLGEPWPIERELALLLATDRFSTRNSRTSSRNRSSVR